MREPVEKLPTNTGIATEGRGQTLLRGVRAYCTASGYIRDDPRYPREELVDGNNVDRQRLRPVDATLSGGRDRDEVRLKFVAKWRGLEEHRS